MNLEAWLALLERRHPKSIDLGLQRCGTVYRQLGSPRPAKTVFTVAGTNGKGSTVAYLAAMCGALGQRSGTYTSPHIFSFNERISVMGESVSDKTLVQAFEQVEAARADISLTYFEFTTLAGFLILQQADLDCAVLEVGLGGRLDTVNLIDADCVIITPIGLDHQDFLGPDIDSIAMEKSAVMRLSTPVVCTEENPPQVLLKAARKLAAPVYRRGRDFDLISSKSSRTQQLSFSISGHSIELERAIMPGQHQLDNLAAALAGLLIMYPDGVAETGQLSKAIAGCRVPGRLQRFSSSPQILLDVGHNELAAQAIAEYMAQAHAAKITCVLAMLEDKSAEAVALALNPVCRRWLCSESPGDRGQSGEALASRIRSALPKAEVSHFKSLGESLNEAISTSEPDETILVFGSFTTVAAASDWLNKHMKHQSHDADKLSQ